jgi:hypothetical protein
MYSRGLLWLSEAGLRLMCTRVECKPLYGPEEEDVDRRCCSIVKFTTAPWSLVPEAIKLCKLREVRRFPAPTRRSCLLNGLHHLFAAILYVHILLALCMTRAIVRRRVIFSMRRQQKSYCFMCAEQKEGRIPLLSDCFAAWFGYAIHKRNTIHYQCGW